MVNIAKLSLRLLFALAVMTSVGNACDRRSFGDWMQLNYIDTRDKVLLRDADGIIALRIASNGELVVQSGTWIDPFTGLRLVTDNAASVEIDHIIPVCFAFERGAEDWTSETKRSFYNDMRYLVAVSASQNGRKSDSAPWEVMPLNPQFACNYVTDFEDGVRLYGLELLSGEREKLIAARELACSGMITSQALQEVNLSHRPHTPHVSTPGQ